jgi:hypothetical protein
MADQVQETQEKQRITCAACGKTVKRIKRYYRNGKFYCDKNCWRNALKKAQAKEETK